MRAHRSVVVEGGDHLLEGVDARDVRDGRRELDDLSAIETVLELKDARVFVELVWRGSRGRYGEADHVVLQVEEPALGHDVGELLVLSDEDRRPQAKGP